MSSHNNYIVTIERKGRFKRISFKEIESLLSVDSSLVLTGPYFLRWDHPQKAEVYFRFDNGKLKVSFPDESTISKMYEIAAKLNAELVGEIEYKELENSLCSREVLEEKSTLFLVSLRTEFVWDEEVFAQLTKSMYFVARSVRCDNNVSRDLISTFWYLSYFIQEWTSHPGFPKKHNQSYYDQSYRIISDLCNYFFKGRSPYMDDTLERSIFGQ